MSVHPKTHLSALEEAIADVRALLGDVASLNGGGNPSVAVAVLALADQVVAAQQDADNLETLLSNIYDGNTLVQPSGTPFQRLGGGTGTGEVIERVGLSTSEGWTRVVFEDVVTPVGVNTNVLLVPANSYVESVQANAQGALTGGGTTVTWSLGISGTVSKYGTAAGGNTLAKNSKINKVPTPAALNAPEQIILVGAVSGGGSAGNTALSVGTVRVRIIYWTLASLDDAP